MTNEPISTTSEVMLDLIAAVWRALDDGATEADVAKTVEQAVRTWDQ